MAGRSETDSLEARVRAALAADPLIDESQVEVEMGGEAVTLVGTVGSYAEKLMAQHVAQAVDGVHDLVNAVDVMLKGADVTYEGRHKVGYFLTAAMIRGDVGAVRHALDLGARAAQRHGELVARHVIALPYAEVTDRLPHA